MYSRHAEKMVSDSYTPQEVKLQIGFFYAGILLLILSAGFRQIELAFFGIIFWAVILVLSIPFAVFAGKKDLHVGIVSPAIIFFRTAAFSMGLLYGIAKGVFR